MSNYERARMDLEIKLGKDSRAAVFDFYLTIGAMGASILDYRKHLSGEQHAWSSGVPNGMIIDFIKLNFMQTSPEACMLGRLGFFIMTISNLSPYSNLVGALAGEVLGTCLHSALVAIEQVGNNYEIGTTDLTGESNTQFSTDF